MNENDQTTFNEEEFLQTPVEEALSTVSLKIPPNDYKGMIAKPEHISMGFTPKGSPVLEVWWTLDAPEVSEQIGKDTLMVRQTLYLDLTAAKRLDTSKGRNVQLGRLREALGQNGPGKWNYNDMVGVPALVKTDLDPNKNVAGDFYEKVKGVSSLRSRAV
jgi:hypothetical protein